MGRFRSAIARKFEFVAQYLSWRRCSLPLMQAPMMMADSTPNRIPKVDSLSSPERSIESTGLMPFSSSIGRGLMGSTLRRQQDVRDSARFSLLATKPARSSPQFDEALTRCHALCESSRSARPNIIPEHPACNISERLQRFSA